MKKIGVLTFHASYNFGSNLQAYALQEYVKKIMNNNVEYEIINFRTDKQIQLYTSFLEKKGLVNFIKRIIFIREIKNIKLKKIYYEKFISEKLNVTNRIANISELKKNCSKYDYLLVGSDQIWNTSAFDFDWSYFLDFVKNKKKLSYAASFGPLKMNWSKEETERIRKSLNDFSFISVREEGSYENVLKLTNKKADINIDPTLLLKKEEWIDVIKNSKCQIPKNDYILLYNLKGKEYVKLAKKISKTLNIPVVVPLFGNRLEIMYGFKKIYATGPIEFLDLIKNSKLVLSSSFHGTLFSIIFNKPFFSLNGDKDFRISNILKTLKLEDRTININDYKEKSSNSFDIDFSCANEELEKQRNKSKEYLLKALK